MTQTTDFSASVVRDPAFVYFVIIIRGYFFKMQCFETHQSCQHTGKNPVKKEIELHEDPARQINRPHLHSQYWTGTTVACNGG